MTPDSWIILCLAYIIGLLSTNLFTVTSRFTPQQLCILIGGLSGLVLVSATVWKKSRIFSYHWWIAAIVAILAVFYLQLRIPQPEIDDISYQVKVTEPVVTVTGKVITEPRLNSNHKIKFWLKAQEISDREKVSGKLYTSVPLLQGTGINLGDEIELKGILYKPQGLLTANGFDFKAYLARKGIFAGMQGLEVLSGYNLESNWGWWKVRRRIIRSHLQALGSPVGQLVSSMVLGRKAVDLPEDIRDRFIEAGLAHVLAASGFHVSLLLGLILKLTNRLAAKPRTIVGIFTLIVYLGLTGIQASVLRACLMGTAVLIAMALETKVKPLGSLLLSGTIILLFDPLLISDLGFQLSFLATFGLIVTMPQLQDRLDWLPTTVSAFIAIPLAASMWVLPLLCYEFNMVATYSIVINILCTPLITAISLAGMISAIVSLIFPIGGSAIAWLLIYPTKLLIATVELFTSLPKSSWAIGQISLAVLLTIYGLLLLISFDRRWRKSWRLILLLAITLVILPIGYRHFSLTQITVLPLKSEPVIVIQDRGQTILVNSGTPKNFKYTVLPFLTQQGIDRLNYYFELEPQFKSDLSKISDRIAIDRVISSEFYSDLQKERSINTDSFQISYEPQLSLLTIETNTEIWLVVGKNKLDLARVRQYVRSNLATKPLTIIGSSLTFDWLRLNPQNIISFSPLYKVTRQNTNTSNYQFHDLNQGTLTWTPDGKLNQFRDTSAFNSIF